MRILSHNRTSYNFGNCKSGQLWLKNKTNSHCMEDRKEGRARRTERQMTWLTKIFTSREGVLVENRLVKKAIGKINSKILMLLSIKWPNTALAACPISMFEDNALAKNLNSGASSALLPTKCIWTFHSSIQKQQKVKQQSKLAKLSNVLCLPHEMTLVTDYILLIMLTQERQRRNEGWQPGCVAASGSQCACCKCKLLFSTNKCKPTVSQ